MTIDMIRKKCLEKLPKGYFISTILENDKKYIVTYGKTDPEFTVHIEIDKKSRKLDFVNNVFGFSKDCKVLAKY